MKNGSFINFLKAEACALIKNRYLSMIWRKLPKMLNWFIYYNKNIYVDIAEQKVYNESVKKILPSADSS